MDALATPPAESETRELLRRLKPRRWKILGSMVLLAGLSAVTAFLMTPYWESKVVMVAAHNEQGGGMKEALDQIGGLASLAGLNVKAGDEEMNEALGVLKSHQLTGAFIADHGLIYKFFAKKWDPVRKTWKSSNPDKWPTPNKAYKYFDEHVRTVTQDKKTGLITMSIVWKDRFEAAQWANELISRVNAEMRHRAMARSASNIAYLQEELNNGSYVQIRDALNHLIENQIRDQMVAAATEEYSFKVVDKAVPADKNDPVWPQKALMIGGGAILGFLFAAMPAFLTGRPRPAGARVAAGVSS